MSIPSQPCKLALNNVLVTTDQNIILRSELIKSVNLDNLENGSVQIILLDGQESSVSGNNLLNFLYKWNPSVLEGRKLSWKKHAWAVHNLIGHPLMQILAFCKQYKLAMIIHDSTIPKPKGFK